MAHFLLRGLQEAFCLVMVGTYLDVVTVLLAAAVGTTPRVAHDSDSIQPQLRLEWSGDKRCRPTEDVIDGLRRLLGADPDAVLTQDFTVHAIIEEQSRGWILVLSTLGLHGPMERRLEAADCGEIAQAASLVLSLWIQPSLSSDDHEVPAALRAVPLGRSVEADASEVPPRKATAPYQASQLVLRRRFWQVRPSKRLRVRGFVGAVAFSGALPEWGWGLLGGVGAVLDDWSLDLLLLWLDHQTRASATLPRVQGDFELVAPGIRIARAWPIASNLNVQPGVWSLVGRLHGEASGPMAASTPSNGEWGAAGLTVDAALRIWRITMNLGFGGGLPFGRPRFFVGNQDLYKTSEYVGFGYFAVGTAFP